MRRWKQSTVRRPTYLGLLGALLVVGACYMAGVAVAFGSPEAGLIGMLMVATGIVFLAEGR